MVGQGVLLECLAASDVREIVTVVRQPMGGASAKLSEVVRADFFDWGGLDLAGFDACFFCLGVSSLGKSEAEYRRVTYELTMALAEALVKASPQAVFVYVSGLGTDASGRQMWAQVKGKTENAVMALPFRAVYCFRPGYIQPLRGVRSKVGWYNALYAGVNWAYPLLRRALPGMVTSSEAVGRAMLRVARKEWPVQVLGNREINAAAVETRAASRS
jgi:uncharacterized protein YbjT (DUF2867 family)